MSGLLSDRCGTYAGWNVHQRAKQTPCGPCKKAHANYMRRWRQRFQCVRGLGWPLAAPELKP